jgi:hypothetical protein
MTISFTFREPLYTIPTTKERGSLAERERDGVRFDPYEEMKQKGADVKEMVYKPGGGYSFQFVDPDGKMAAHPH